MDGGTIAIIAVIFLCLCLISCFLSAGTALMASDSGEPDAAAAADPAKKSEPAGAPASSPVPGAPVKGSTRYLSYSGDANLFIAPPPLKDGKFKSVPGSMGRGIIQLKNGSFATYSPVGELYTARGPIKDGVDPLWTIVPNSGGRGIIQLQNGSFAQYGTDGELYTTPALDGKPWKKIPNSAGRDIIQLQKDRKSVV